MTVPLVPERLETAIFFLRVESFVQAVNPVEIMDRIQSVPRGRV